METVYHHREHTETGQTPLQRFLAGGPPEQPGPALLGEAFAWSEHRQVTKTATISVHSNTYQVDAALIGRTIEVVFDPLDMTELAVRYQGRDLGKAVPFQITRHVHPHADAPPAPPAAPTGIDYLNLIAADHQQQLALAVPGIAYEHLTALTEQPDDAHPTGDQPPGPDTGHPDLIPGQLALPEPGPAGQAGEPA